MFRGVLGRSKEPRRTLTNAIPDLEDFSTIHMHQDTFARSLDWDGAGKDSERIVGSPKEGTAMVVVIHRVPRFVACTPQELSDRWKGCEPLVHVTTLLYQQGDLEYLTDVDNTGEGCQSG